MTNKFGILDGFYNAVLAVAHSTGVAPSLLVLVLGCVLAGVAFQLTKRVSFLRPWHCQRAGYMMTMAYGALTFPLLLSGL